MGRDQPMNEIILMPDPRIAAIPVQDSGEPANAVYGPWDAGRGESLSADRH
jgi:hypothetical protein